MISPESSTLTDFEEQQFLCVDKYNHCFVSYIKTYVGKFGHYVDEGKRGCSIIDVTELKALYRIKLQ